MVNRGEARKGITRLWHKYTRKKGHTMKAIGLIVGHGFVKAASATTSVAFPAVAAPAGAAEYAAETGRGDERLRMNGSGEWLVGQEAITFAPQRLVSILDRARYTSPSFAALARHALGLVAKEKEALSILTGMPQAWFSDTAARTALETAIIHAAAPWEQVTVKVAPEAAGVFYAYVFESGRLDTERTRGSVGVIDAGYRDVNVALFDGGRYVAGESVAGGMSDALKEVRRLISQAYGLELSLHEVDQVVRQQCLTLNGLQRPLPDGAHAALVRGLDTVIATARSLWPNGGRTLRAIVLGGGGARVLGERIQQAFPQAVVPGDDPQLAGARGFAAAAQAALKR